MHVITLLSAREDPRVSHALVYEVADRLGDAEHAWLEDEVACDLFVERAPCGDVLDGLRHLVSGEGVDLVVQERAGRRKSLLVADMDSTMIEEECIDELADEIGVKPQVAAITERAMNGEIAFEPALRERVALLKGLPADTIAHVLETRIGFTPGGPDLVRTMRAHGAYTVLVSGGFTAFTGPVSERLGFDETRANRLDVTEGKLAGTVAEPVLGADAKLAALREIAAARGLTATDALAVGDGANDLPMILAAGTGVAFRAKPVVAAAAPFRLEHSDLSALLFIQGYRIRDFVE